MSRHRAHAPAYQRENCGKHYECRYGHHTDYTISAHLHRFSEWLFVESGEMTMYLDGQRLHVRAGEAVLILPHAVHAYTAETHNRSFCVVCSNDFIPCLLEALQDRQPLSPVFAADAVAGAFAAIGETAPQDSVRFMALLNTVADAFLKQAQLVPLEGRRSNPPYRAVLTYIDENYREDISLTSMAAALGYHEKYLSAVIGSMSNMNFRTLLASRRIECACSLLCEKERGYSIAEVALASGFSSINTFNRAFKEFCGVTPRAFRNGK